MHKDEKISLAFLFLVPLAGMVGLFIYDIIHYPDNFFGYLLAQIILLFVLGVPLLKLLYFSLMAIVMNIPPFRHLIEKSEWYNRY